MSILIAPASFSFPSACTVSPNWTYEQAFARNRGLISEDEQQSLRNCRVAIPGLGGVGGLHLITLARLGVGKFNVADPDSFEPANFNRQYGATIKSLGRSKVDVMLAAAMDINPDIEICGINDYIDKDNIEEFLTGVDVVVDGIDLYEIDARRLIFAEAAKKNIPAITAGPMGFSTCWLTFAPQGMSFDQYFDLNDSMTYKEKIVAFLIGLCPRMLPLKYMDRTVANPITHRAPSVSSGCQLAAGVMAAEVTKTLLKRGQVKPAPYYQIFDAYLGKHFCGTLRMGNRSPWQLAKRMWLSRDWKVRFPDFQ